MQWHISLSTVSRSRDRLVFDCLRASHTRERRRAKRSVYMLFLPVMAENRKHLDNSPYGRQSVRCQIALYFLLFVLFHTFLRQTYSDCIAFPGRMHIQRIRNFALIIIHTKSTISKPNSAIVLWNKKQWPRFVGEAARVLTYY